MCPQLAGAGSVGSPGATAGWGLLDYKTEKYVMTRNWRVGALQRLLQFGIMVYVVGSPRQKRLPGAGPGTPDFHHNQTQRGFRDSDQGAWKPAVGCGRLREATSDTGSCYVAQARVKRLFTGMIKPTTALSLLGSSHPPNSAS
ncbi:uncharacterized protein LOC100978723 isoform X5 [Pan paniscus]|uniref:uncharacterized protein LOC100978723 isoform X5 n=1 Tax=Pan paniscus TaxID=9597 RepID=UPI0015605951